MFCPDGAVSGVEGETDCHFLQCGEISRTSLAQFRDSGLFSDVIMDVFGKRITAHKVVLAANSEYFATLFCSPLNENSGEIIYFGEESEDDTRMELTERAVRVLVDYLYTGRLCLQSDLVLLLEVARAANCFQLENVVRWTHGLVLANVSEVVRARRGYDVMGEMDLLTHLQSLQLTDWEDIRDSDCYLVLAEAASVSVYDPSADLWTALPLVGQTGLSPYRAAVHRNSLFLIGKRDGEITQELGRLDLNDLDTGLEWEESLQDHQVEGREEPGLVSAGGYLYRLAAGDTEVHRFSVMIGVWGQADPIQQTRRGACCVALDSFVYIIGGETSNKTVTNSVELYQNTLFTIGETNNGNEGTETRSVQGKTNLSPLLLARSEAEAVALSESRTIYVVGGRTDSNNLSTTLQAGGCRPCLEVYDVAKDCWKLAPEMKFARSRFRCASVEDRIVVVGGYIEGVATDIVEMFNITTQTWSELRHLPSPAADFALAKVEQSFLSPTAIKKHFKYSGDVVVEETKRTQKPLSEHFNWKL